MHTENTVGQFVKAVAFAAEKHRTQRRKDADASPYINHPIALANVLANEGGISDISILCAAVLHDTVSGRSTTPYRDSWRAAIIASAIFEWRTQ